MQGITIIFTRYKSAPTLLAELMSKFVEGGGSGYQLGASFTVGLSRLKELCISRRCCGKTSASVRICNYNLSSGSFTASLGSIHTLNQNMVILGDRVSQGAAIV